jgi:hypothetical protein
MPLVVPSAAGLTLGNLFPGIPYGQAFTVGAYLTGAAALFYMFGPFVSSVMGFEGRKFQRR